MTIIADTNIIISACLNAQSELFQMLTTTYRGLDFTTPDFALEEIVHHQTEICTKSRKNISVFRNNLSVVLGHLLILPNEYLSEKNIKEAEIFTSPIDIDDTIFVAFSMALDSLLWTGDLKLYKALRRKGFKNVILTKELKQILKGI
jgi:predicted nucleic acid-binding protein